MAFFQEIIHNLPRIKDGAFVINLDGKKSKGTHWVPLFIFLKLNIFLMKYETKSEINQLLIIHLGHKLMNLLCVDFIVSLL